MDRIEDFEVNSPRWLSLEDFEGEVWKDIPNYNGNYQASNFGRIKSKERYDVYYRNDYKTFCKRHRNNKILTVGFDRNGYLYCNPITNGKAKNTKVHRLIAITFIPNTNNFPEINHKNEIKTDNRVENLEWCTGDYNRHYGTSIQRISEKLKNHPWHSMAVYQFDFNGNYVAQYASAAEAERQTGIKQTHINESCKDHSRTSGGFFWCHSNDINKMKEYAEKRKENPPSCTEKIVCQYTLDGTLIREYSSIEKAGQESGVFPQSISACCRRYKGYQSSGGFRWAYKGEKLPPLKKRYINTKHKF